MDARTRTRVVRSGAIALVTATVAVAVAVMVAVVAVAAAAPTPSAAPKPTTTVSAGTRDGSLGDADTKQACSLLTASEIEAQFGGPVAAATPVYPYCQWLVGDDAFVAVTIYRQPIEEARQFHPVRFDTSGLGDDGGYIATTRAVFFGKNGVTYSILWQKVGDFTTVETDRLVALAQAVLARV